MFFLWHWHWRFRPRPVEWKWSLSFYGLRKERRFFSLYSLIHILPMNDCILNLFYFHFHQNLQVHNSKYSNNFTSTKDISAMIEKEFEFISWYLLSWRDSGIVLSIGWWLSKVGKWSKRHTYKYKFFTNQFCGQKTSSKCNSLSLFS